MRNILTITALAALLVPTLATEASARPARGPLPHPGGVFLTYVNKPAVAGVITKSPELILKIGSADTPAAQVRPVMDTGSVGIVISRDAFAGSAAGMDTGVPGSITYSSSGKTMSGTTGHASVTIEGANGNAVTTTPIDFLIVDAISCVANARHCHPTQKATGIAMMGIGFARQDKNGSETFTPARNPFIHIEPVAGGNARRGYIVTAEGVQVGIDPSQLTGVDFRLTKLQPDQEHQDQDHPDNSDWLPQEVGINVDGRFARGTVLIDTGVTDMYMTVPYENSVGLTVSACEETSKADVTYGSAACNRLEAEAKTGDYSGWTTLRSDTDVAIGISSDVDPTGVSAAYLFKVAGDAAVAPNRLLLVKNLTAPSPAQTPEPTFVNTSVKFLNGFSYLFDQEDGYTGFRRYTAGNQVSTKGSVDYYPEG